MTLPNFKRTLERYASNKTGALNAHRSAAYVTARFLADDDDHARTFRVPTPEHVARFGIAPVIERAALTSPRDVREAVHVFLSGVHRRYHGPLAHRTPQYGSEHLAEAPPFLPLSDHYAGLHAALRFTFAADHPDNSGAHFDRWEYEEAIASATFAELRTRAAETARKAAREERAAAREEHRVTPTPAPADDQPARTERDSLRSAYIIRVMREHLAAVQPGDKMTRADLVDVVLSRAADDPLAPALPPRKVAAVLIQHAEELGLTERVLSSTTDSKRTRARGFVYTPQIITEETTDMDQIDHLTDLTAAANAAADAFERLAAAQDAAYLSGDRTGALQLQRERLAPAPVTDLPAYRARRAA